MTSFSVEPLYPFWDEAAPLFDLHYREVAESQHVIKLEPDTDLYEKMFAAGLIEIHTVRDGEKLIGYSLFVIQPHLHYKSSLTAHNDIVFIHPDYRKGMLAHKFIKFSIGELKKKNPQRITWHMKPFLDFSKIIERLGGHLFEHVYSMVLEE